MEWLNNFWQTIKPYFADVTISGLVSVILYACLRQIINKLSKSSDDKQQKLALILDETAKKMKQDAIDGTLSAVASTSVKTSIEPLVKSEFVKITEVAMGEVKEELDKEKKRYNNLVDILDALASYFDASIGVPDEAKEKLHKAIDNARDGSSKIIETELVLNEVAPQLVEEIPQEENKEENKVVNVDRV